MINNMKNSKNYFTFIILLSVVCLFSNCSVKKDYYPEGAVTSFKDLIQEFKDPPKEYGSVPLYVWNGRMTRDGIDRDMQAFKKAGFGGVFVHPRPGLITEYLSQTWFDLFRYTVDKGKELDMNVWIYDENSYPSGFGGGHVPAQMPESYNQGQGLQLKDTTIVPINYGDYFLILKRVNGEYVDITSTAKEEQGKTGEYSLFTKTFFEKSDWFGGWTYVDLLYPGVTEKFIDVTMTGYEKIAGDEFGKTIPGVFSDEPQIRSPGGIRWTPDLFSIFKNQWGYDLKLQLPALYKEVDEWKKVRHNYTQTLLWLFIERWSKPQYEYHEAKGLIFTGHYYDHKWPRMYLGGDNMAMYTYHQMPGIDMLFNQFNEDALYGQFGNIRSVKELASVANQMGRKRTLCETYGGAGWDLTFEDMKRLGDWEYALGVNFLNQHLSYFTLAGARKYDYPPSFSSHSPWWKNYNYLNAYYKRLSLVLSSGIQKNNILIIEPTTTAWLYDSYIHDSRNEQVDVIGKTFQQFITRLEKNQVEYDLGSEEIIKKYGTVEKKQLIVGRSSYSKIVIPPLTENLNQFTFQLLKDFVANDGVVLAFSIPTHIDGVPNDDLAILFDKDQKNILNFSKLSREVLADNFINDDLIFEYFEGGKLYHHRRHLQDGQIVFLVNSSLKDETKGVLTVRGKDAILLNAFTGEVFDYADTINGNTVRVSFSLPPAESLLLFISDSKLKEYKLTDDKDKYTLIHSKSDIKVWPERDNILTIDFCDLTVSGKTERDMNVYDANMKVFKENGFNNGNPWNHSIQYKTSVLDQGNFSEESGFTATFNFEITEKFDYSKIRAVVEQPQLWAVSINGHEIESEPGESWLDHSFGVFSIGKWIMPGKNNISVKCYPMKIYAEIEPVYIVGDFSVEPAQKGWVINAGFDKLNVGNWKDQGLPFYSWEVLYKKTYDIRKKSKNYYIVLGNWKGTVAEVIVNRKHSGTIALHTDTLDVSNFIEEGINDIEVKIIGSLKNLLGPHHNNHKPGKAGPKQWRGVKEYPAGSNYQMLDYGLMDDIYLYKK
jgi:hypothetical protein